MHLKYAICFGNSNKGSRFVYYCSFKTNFSGDSSENFEFYPLEFQPVLCSVSWFQFTDWFAWELSVCFPATGALKMLDKWKSCILWRYEIDLYTFSSHNMISKPIKLTVFRLTFAVLNQSVTLTSCRGSGQEESKFFNVKLTFIESTTATTIFRSKHVYDIRWYGKLGYKFVLMTNILQSIPL